MYENVANETTSNILLIMPWIIAIIAIVFPNYHQKKMKSMELNHEHYIKQIEHKRTIYEDFLRKYSRAKVNSNTEKYLDFLESSLLVMPYLSAEARTKPEFKEFEECLFNEEEEISDRVYEIVSGTIINMIIELDQSIEKLVKWKR